MPVHNKAIKGLSPEDYLVIEKEHKLLEKYLTNLRNACACSTVDKLADCPPCDHEQKVSCQGRLPSFLFYIIELAIKHFEHEESIMLNRPQTTKNKEYFRLHHRAHIDIVQTLQALIDESLSLRSEDNTPEIYRNFYDSISDIFEKHDQLFDAPFIKSTQPEATNSTHQES